MASSSSLQCTWTLFAFLYLQIFNIRAPKCIPQVTCSFSSLCRELRKGIFDSVLDKSTVPGSQQMSGYWADWSCLLIRIWHPLKHELSNDDEFSSLLWFCKCRSYSIRTVKHTAIVFRHIVAEGPQPHALLNAYLWAQYPKNLFMSPRFCQLSIQAAQPNTSVLLPEPIFLPVRSLQFFHSSTVLKQSWENPSLKTQVCFFFFFFILCVSLNAGVRAFILYVQCVNKISIRTAKL